MRKPSKQLSLDLVGMCTYEFCILTNFEPELKSQLRLIVCLAYVFADTRFRLNFYSLMFETLNFLYILSTNKKPNFISYEGDTPSPLCTAYRPILTLSTAYRHFLPGILRTVYRQKQLFWAFPFS